MKIKAFSILIFLILAAIALAGVFYTTRDETQIDQTQDLTRNNVNVNLPPARTTEQEITTATPPLIIKGEISKGNPNKKQIIFTFDGGSGTNSAQKILDITRKHNVKTTFFVTGSFAEKNQELIKQISQEGHEIFNHTYSHPHLTQITDEEIKTEFDKTEQIISGLTGKTTKPFFRPPYGERNKHVLEIAQGLEYQSVYWTLDALDWMPDKTAKEVRQRIYDRLTNGAIILMHVGDDITGDILDEVFTKIENDGYKIVGLTDGLN